MHHNHRRNIQPKAPIDLLHRLGSCALPAIAGRGGAIHMGVPARIATPPGPKGSSMEHTGDRCDRSRCLFEPNRYTTDSGNRRVANRSCLPAATSMIACVPRERGTDSSRTVLCPITRVPTRRRVGIQRFPAQITCAQVATDSAARSVHRGNFTWTIAQNICEYDHLVYGHPG